MIFVTVGSNEARFDRMLEWLQLPDDEGGLVQHGPSLVRCDGAEHVDYMPFDELVGHVRAARVVVTHAGVGSIMVALANDRRPVVVPRLARYGEAVDDHQLPFARRMAEKGLVTLVEDRADLAAALAGDEASTAPANVRASRLSTDLRACISGLLA